MNTISPLRRLLGDLLLAAMILLTLDVVFVMLHKIQTVVLKADYQRVFVHELILCAVLLLFALDVRFNLFTRSKLMALRVSGWAVRTVVALMALAILFFCGKVIAGSVINTSGPADHTIVLGLALENGQPTGDLLSRLSTAQAYLAKYPDTDRRQRGCVRPNGGRRHARYSGGARRAG